MHDVGTSKFYDLRLALKFGLHDKKLRKVTYTAAVCKLRGDIFCDGLFPSVAQLSSAFPNAADMLPLSSSSTLMTSLAMQHSLF